MCLRIVEEVGPVRVRLHVSELKQLSEAQRQDVVTDLTHKDTEILLSLTAEPEHTSMCQHWGVPCP